MFIKITKKLSFIITILSINVLVLTQKLDKQRDLDSISNEFTLYFNNLSEVNKILLFTCNILDLCDGQNYEISLYDEENDIFNKIDSSSLSTEQEEIGFFKIVSLYYTLNGQSSLKILVKLLFNPTDLQYFFYKSQANSIIFENFDTSEVTTMESMFKSCSQLTILDLSSFNTEKVTDMSSMFDGCENLVTLNINNFDTSNVEYMDFFFYKCKSMKNFDIANFDTSNAKGMSYMFSKCESLQSINLENFNTINVKVMSYMFYACSNLKSIDLNNFKTDKLNNLEGMFIFCTSLESVKIDNFDTSKVTNMMYLFHQCKSLKSLNLDNFGSSRIQYLDNMFFGCESLTSLYLEKFDFSNVQSYENFTYGLDNLEYCKFEKWDKNFNKTCKKSMILMKCESCENIDDNDIDFYCIKTLKSKEYKFRYFKNETSINDYTKRSCLYFIDEKNYDFLYLEPCNVIYSGVCYEKCPINTYLSDDGICLDKKDPNLIFETKLLDIPYKELDGETVNKFLMEYSNKSATLGNYVVQYINDEYQLIIYDFDINKTEIDNLSLNISNMDFTECFEILRKNNLMPDKMIYLQEDFNDNHIDTNYMFFDSKTNSMFDFHICEKTNVKINRFLIVNNSETIEKAMEKGYNFLNKDDDFYKNVCSPYTTDNGTDIILEDRIKDIYEYDILDYYKNCSYDNFKIDDTRVKCNTEFKPDFSNKVIIHTLNRKEFVDKLDFFKFSNFYVISCYSLFFSLDGQLGNYGAYLFYVCFILLVIFTVYSFFRGFLYIENIVIDMIKKKFFIDNKNFKENNSQKHSKNKKNKNDINSKNELDNIQDNKICNNRVSNANPSRKKKINTKIHKALKGSRRTTRSSRNNENSEIKSKAIFLKSIGDKSENLRKENENNNICKIKINSNKKNKKKCTENEIPAKLSLIDAEINTLAYSEALIKDTRSFQEYYFSLIRQKHILIYIFYEDYNIKPVKITLFILLFSLNLVINALFFKDSTMHNVYKYNNYLVNFVYQLPGLIYSTIISLVISKVIKRIGLTQRNIINLKKKAAESKKEWIKQSKSVLKCIKIKFIIFFIITFILFILFIYYIGCFCAVYKNIQTDLIIDSVVGFFLSLLYPFGINLLPGIFRIPSLNRKNERLYKFSRLIAML